MNFPVITNIDGAGMDPVSTDWKPQIRHKAKFLEVSQLLKH